MAALVVQLMHYFQIMISPNFPGFLRTDSKFFRSGTNDHSKSLRLSVEELPKFGKAAFQIGVLAIPE